MARSIACSVPFLMSPGCMATVVAHSPQALTKRLWANLPHLDGAVPGERPDDLTRCQGQKRVTWATMCQCTLTESAPPRKASTAPRKKIRGEPLTDEDRVRLASDTRKPGPGVTFTQEQVTALLAARARSPAAPHSTSFHDRIAGDKGRANVQWLCAERTRNGRKGSGATDGLRAVAIEFVDAARTKGGPCDRDSAVRKDREVEDDRALPQIEERALGKSVGPKGIDASVKLSEVGNQARVVGPVVDCIAIRAPERPCGRARAAQSAGTGDAPAAAATLAVARQAARRAGVNERLNRRRHLLFAVEIVERPGPVDRRDCDGTGDKGGTGQADRRRPAVIAQTRRRVG